jgi:hypothetical protein
MGLISKIQIKQRWVAFVLYALFGLCSLFGILILSTYLTTVNDVIKLTGTVESYTESLCDDPGVTPRGSLALSKPCYRPVISYQYNSRLRTLEGARVDDYPPKIGVKQEIYVRENSKGEILAYDYSQRHITLILGVILIAIFLPALLFTIRIRKSTLKKQYNNY